MNALKRDGLPSLLVCIICLLAILIIMLSSCTAQKVYVKNVIVHGKSVPVKRGFIVKHRHSYFVNGKKYWSWQFEPTNDPAYSIVTNLKK